MAEPCRSRLRPTLVWVLCILTGLMMGVSGFSAESNHPTYLPPGLRYLDPGFLAHDWWLNSARHYHLAFFGLVAALAGLDILEAGLAALNIAAVAVAMHACFRIVRHMRGEYPVVTLCLIVALLIATYGFCTVGSAFLFSASLQPSTIATTATILAFATFLEGRLGRCSLWLALAGAFHANFLAVNFAAFGLAYTFATAQARPWRNIVSRDLVLGLVRLLWPSLVAAVISAPLILSFQTDSVGPEPAAQADWIFFHFAVPFHYTPLSFLERFPSFLALQLLGFVWTSRAIVDPWTRRMALGLQIALAVLIWSATALTTAVFLPQVSRLFFWRLAPFALLLAALIAVVGLMRVIARTEADDHGDGRRLRITLYTLPFLAIGGAPLIGQWLATAPFQPALLAFAVLLAMAAAQHRAKGPAAIGKPVLTGASVALIAFSFLAQPSPIFRYSLIEQPARRTAGEELFHHVAAATPADAQFVIPPTLERFRLLAKRAVVVDLKALPMDRSSLVEWYSRLEAVSGMRKPQSPLDVVVGYEALDAARLDDLRCRYRVTHAVVERRDTFAPPGWRETFRNRYYRVLQAAGAPCRPRALVVRKASTLRL